LRNDDAFTVPTVLGQSSSTAWTTGDVLVCNFFMSALDGIYENMILDARGNLRRTNAEKKGLFDLDT
jgi:hypothetical protein